MFIRLIIFIYYLTSSSSQAAGFEGEAAIQLLDTMQHAQHIKLIQPLHFIDSLFLISIVLTFDNNFTDLLSKSFNSSIVVPNLNLEITLSLP